MKGLNSSFATASILAATLAAIPAPLFAHGESASNDHKAPNHFSGGITTVTLTMAACTQNDLTYVVSVEGDASTKDLKRLGNGNINEGINRFLAIESLQQLEREWNEVIGSISAPPVMQPPVKEMVHMTANVLNQNSAVHFRAQVVDTELLENDGPGCSVRLSPKF